MSDIPRQQRADRRLEARPLYDNEYCGALHDPSQGHLHAWEPAWKCSSFRQSSIPADARVSTTDTTSDDRNPNLDLSPLVVPQCLATDSVGSVAKLRYISAGLG